MYILGISCYYHDSAAALLKDGEIVAAAHEERFTRKKHDDDFPKNAIKYCLGHAGITAKDLDAVGFYDKPFVKFERILSSAIATFPRSLPSFLKSMPIWLKQKLWVRSLIQKELGYGGPIYFTEHHESHAASTFLVSPFEEAAILTVDGVGEWATATFGVGKGNEIRILKEIRFPDSLGLLYSAFTYYLGFKVNSAEYKVMGLAPYGKPTYYEKARRLVEIHDDGSFKMDMKYFDYAHGLKMTSKAFDDLFGRPPRDPEGKLDQFHMDMAATVQKLTEEIVMNMGRTIHRETGQKYLCLAGGVALNCVANGILLREGPFEDLFVQPAAGDAGGAVGVAAFIYHSILGKPREHVWKHAFLGPEYSDAEIERYLKEQGAPYHKMTKPEVLAKTADLLTQQKVIGWFQGRMEFGPRALGNRSIIADARNPENWKRVNLKIKFRESFRPFAPTVLEERASDYFELDRPSPYMLLVAPVRQEHQASKSIPAVTHVDGSARIQTINRDQNAVYYDLIKEFDRQTGCPVIINTSFNVRGEPIICTPHDAYLCFMRTNMDNLVLSNCLLYKEEQPALKEDVDWRTLFELD
jgi:carbamoyltransferase